MQDVVIGYAWIFVIPGHNVATLVSLDIVVDEVFAITHLGVIGRLKRRTIPLVLQ